MTITQIPLKVAFATTIHKIQGITLDYAEIDMGNIFEYGQGYVALSRVKKLEGLSIKNLDIDKIVAHPAAIEFYKKLNLNKCFL
jgi:ATP-dependent DNA helicase PIF1